MPSEASVAIVGLACRFPGSPDAARFWSLLSEGRHAIGTVPSDRWSDRSCAGWAPQPDLNYVDAAGLIEDVASFDAGFFGIAPREAEQMDPQQRILLEVAWEALEAAGEPREKLRGSRTGVYVGISSVDYARIQPRDGRQLTVYSATGNAQSVAANRLSYVLDLRGPSLAVDTACSSSLMAVHLACRALRAGEIDRALVGGVNLILSPDLMVVFSAARMLAPDGRCKTFDAGADGYVRGEGCGVVVLKRLPDALAQRDPIVAIIRGSAANQDGRSNGLTAPNGRAQQAVIEEALADAHVAGATIDAVELHGTGTALGDPIEALALGTALGAERADGRPCHVGSVKTNIGHLEAAAGIAGLIKAALALKHGALPPSLNFERPNPEISLPTLGLAVATSAVDLPERALVGVSSFGFGGTNAHVVLQGAGPRPRQNETVRDAPWVLPLSAQTPEALRDLCGRYAERLTTLAADDLRDAVYTASVRRTHHDYRAAAVGEDAAALAQELAHFATGTAARLQHGRCPPAGPRKIALWLARLPPAAAEHVRTSMRWSASFARHCEALRPALAANDLPADLLSIEPTAAHLMHAQAVALLAALAAEVRGWGLSFVTTAGTGPGAAIAAWCRGERSLSDALGAALDEQHETDVPDLPARSEILVIGASLPAAISTVARVETASPACLAQAQAQLYAAGHALDWGAIQPPGAVVPLPTYPWQRQRFWFDTPAVQTERAEIGGLPEASKAQAPARRAPAEWIPAPATYADHVWEQLDAVCAAFSREALIHLGWGPGDPPADWQTLVERCRIAVERVPAFRRLLANLVRFGAVRRDGALYAFGATEGADALATLDALCRTEPSLATELALLRRAARSLAGVLRGEVDPLSLLFPDGDLRALRHLYAEAPAARHGHRLLVARVRTAIAARRATRPVRIIEIGAGTGGTTGALLQGLADRPVEYVFTDVSEHFLAAAARTFGDRVTCRRLDIEGLPSQQGFADASFDAVVAVNVLHATRSLRDSIAHAKRLLAPGGTMVLIETTRPNWALELTFGLTDGWWRFNDHDLRPEQPLIDAPAWVELLGEAGLHGCHAVPCDPRGEQSLISGVVGETVSPARWLIMGGGISFGPLLAQAIVDHGEAQVLADDFAAPGAARAASADAEQRFDHVVDLTLLNGSEGAVAASPTHRAFAGASVWTVTRNSMPSDVPAKPAGAVSATERGHIDLDGATPERAARAILCAIEAFGASRRIAIRDGRILVPRAQAKLLGIGVDAAPTAAAERQRGTDETESPAAAPAPDIARLLANSFPTERRALLETRLSALAAAVLKLPVDAVDAERGLQDQGMDSLMALEFRAQLQRLTSTRLPTTLALERPSIRSLTEYLLPILTPASPDRHTADARAGYVATAAGGTRRRPENDAATVDVPSLLASLARLPEEEAYRRLLASGQDQ
jgi:3-oxoacyl-(acyl-carrier-protein) synthase/SAM-dependent methyltransferase